MTQWLEFVLAAAAGIVLGLLVAPRVMRRIRTSRRFRTVALGTAALFSFFTYYDPRERAATEESESETKRKKDDDFGDPPDPE